MAYKEQTTDAHIRVIDYSKNAFEYKSHHYGLTKPGKFENTTLLKILSINNHHF